MNARHTPDIRSMEDIDQRLLSNELVLVGAERRIGTGERVTRHYAGTGAPLRDVHMGSVADVEEAVAAARAAHPTWIGLAPSARRDILLASAALLRARSDRIAAIGAIDAGIPISTVQGMVHHAAEWLTYYAGWIDKANTEVVPTGPMALHYVRHEPYGVVGVISPSNSTVSAMVLAPLLAAGNCAVMKSSEFTSNVTAEYLQVFLDAGMPPGVVNCVPGGADLGQALVRHPGIHKIHFTGSCEVGAQVGSLAASLLKPVGMELGGKSANIVYEDAVIDMAAEVAVRALVRQSGQSCVAGTRVIAHRSVIGALLDATVAKARSQPLGDPLHPATVVGPVVSAAARDRIFNVIERARDEQQGRVVLGGEKPGGVLNGGYFIQPTIFADVDNASGLAQNEIFGPVIAFIPFDAEHEAVALANASRFGLAAYVHTRRLDLAHRTAASLEAGTLWINGAAGVLPGAPFGGMKDSGYGRVGGRVGLEEFVRPKSVWMGL